MNIQTTSTNDRIEYRSSETDRGAVTSPQGFTAFGRWEFERWTSGDDVRMVERFVCSHAKPSRKYASRKSAERQIAKWMAA